LAPTRTAKARIRRLLAVLEVADLETPTRNAQMICSGSGDVVEQHDDYRFAVVAERRRDEAPVIRMDCGVLGTRRDRATS
jgi:hypothetical protein